MEKGDEDVSKETIRQALAVQTKALLGFTNVLNLMNKSMKELTGAVKAKSGQVERLMEKKDG